MASKKKTVTRKFTNDPSKAKEAHKLAKKARREFTDLLERGEAGKITEKELDVSLKEIFVDVRRVLFFKRHTLR
jgi:hypothetical protein